MPKTPEPTEEARGIANKLLRGHQPTCVVDAMAADLDDNGVAALVAERDALRERVSGLIEAADRDGQRILALQADARRLDWIHNNCDVVMWDDGGSSNLVLDVNCNDFTNAREAIDSARAAEEGKGEA